MFHVRSILFILVVLMVAVTGQGYAQVTQYYDVTSFNGATSSYTILTEDFELITVTLNQNSGGSNSLSFNDFGVTSGLESLKVLDNAYTPPPFPQNTGNHNTTPGGMNFLSSDTNTVGVTDYMMLTFSDPLFAFGLNFVDIETGASVTVGGLGSYDVAATSRGGVQFFGIVSDTSFTTVQLTMAGADGNWTIDDVQYASTPIVPEPVSSVLFVIGGTVLAGRRFMKRRK